MALTTFSGPVQSLNGFIGSFTATSITADSAVITDVDLGSSGVAGSLDVFPASASKGKLELVAADNSGNTTTVITNAAQAGARTYTIPDAGASASFVMTEGAQTINGAKTFGSNIIGNLTGNVTGNVTGAVTGGAITSNVDKTDFSKFVSLNDILIASVGTWTRTRIAQGNYVLRHTAADDTSVIGIDITPMLRSTASKGFKLTSIDVIYSIGTLDLDAHTATLDRIEYANNVAVSVNSIAFTGSLATATQANPYVSALTVSSAAFDNVADSKYVFELTVNAAATSAYDLYGLVLKFARNDL